MLALILLTFCIRRCDLFSVRSHHVHYNFHAGRYLEPETDVKKSWSRGARNRCEPNMAPPGRWAQVADPGQMVVCLTAPLSDRFRTRSWRLAPGSFKEKADKGCRPRVLADGCWFVQRKAGVRATGPGSWRLAPSKAPQENEDFTQSRTPRATRR